MKSIINLAARARRAPPVVGQTPSDAIYRENKWQLLRYRPRPGGRAYRTPVVLVPSLINRHYVLDLMPSKSLVEYLVARGHDVYAIDWGQPADEDRFLTFDDICDRYLGRALRRAAEAAGGVRPHVLGYCMGGILATIHASVRPENVASLTLLASPVNFHDDGLLSVWLRQEGFDVKAIIGALGNLPWQLMQAAFHMLRPTLTLAKVVGLIDRGESDEFIEGFLATETWGNDNVPFPGLCFERYADELYRKNALMNDTFYMSGEPARLGNVRCPLYVITFEHDNIVPWQSASVLLDRAGSSDKQHLHMPGGHVGAVIARAAAKGLWPAMSAFWAARDGGPPASRPKSQPAPASTPEPANAFAHAE